MANTVQVDYPLKEQIAFLKELKTLATIKASLYKENGVTKNSYYEAKRRREAAMYQSIINSLEQCSTKF